MLLLGLTLPFSQPHYLCGFKLGKRFLEVMIGWFHYRYVKFFHTTSDNQNIMFPLIGILLIAMVKPIVWLGLSICKEELPALQSLKLKLIKVYFGTKG